MCSGLLLIVLGVVLLFEAKVGFPPIVSGRGICGLWLLRYGYGKCCGMRYPNYRVLYSFSSCCNCVGSLRGTRRVNRDAGGPCWMDVIAGKSLFRSVAWSCTVQANANRAGESAYACHCHCES